MSNDKYNFRLPPSASLDEKTIVGMAIDFTSQWIPVRDITVGENKSDLPSWCAPTTCALTASGTPIQICKYVREKGLLWTLGLLWGPEAHACLCSYSMRCK